MSLRTDIAYRGDHIFRDLTLNADVVLFGVLRFQLLGHLTEEQDRTEVRPVNRCSRRRRQKSVERVGNWPATLQFKWRLEHSFGNQCASAKWRLRAQLLEHELLDRV